jgi:hypothetical protein
MTAVLEATGLHKRFGKLVGVEKVSLHLAQGEVLAFLGPNGAGKTTTIKMLAGLGNQLLLMGSIALVLLLITGARLSFTPLMLLPITTVLPGGYGLGFAMASLALLFKRVQRLLVIVPDSVSSSPFGDELTRPKGYAFFAERSEGCALGFKKIAS